MGIYSWEDVPHFVIKLFLGKFSDLLIKAVEKSEKPIRMGMRVVAGFLSGTLSGLTDSKSYGEDEGEGFLVDMTTESTNAWLDLLPKHFQQPTKYATKWGARIYIYITDNHRKEWQW